MTRVFDDRQCRLGEGPLWHPERQQMFWFDILNRQLLSRQGDKPLVWQFDEYVSAAGWVNRSELMIASQSKLFLFNLDTGASEDLCDLEADNAVTRSNDGRADPKGGFWIGTMGINAEKGAGAIYRFRHGQLHKLFDDITISNAICFSPDGGTAYFADTETQVIQKVALDEAGWPTGSPEPFVDLSAEDLNPDGAVVDADGFLWNAQWGAGRVARYAPDGCFVDAVSLPGQQATCPAFGGPDLTSLFATTAAEGLSGESEGRTYVADIGVRGQNEHQVVL